LKRKKRRKKKRIVEKGISRGYINCQTLTRRRNDRTQTANRMNVRMKIKKMKKRSPHCQPTLRSAKKWIRRYVRQNAYSEAKAPSITIMKKKKKKRS
jgi:hypothetical protein